MNFRIRSFLNDCLAKAHSTCDKVGELKNKNIFMVINPGAWLLHLNFYKILTEKIYGAIQ